MRDLSGGSPPIAVICCRESRFFPRYYCGRVAIEVGNGSPGFASGFFGDEGPEFRTMNRVSSKLVHPTAWSVLAVNAETNRFPDAGHPVPIGCRLYGADTDCSEGTMIAMVCGRIL